MIIRAIDHEQHVNICDGTEMLRDYDAILFTYRGVTFKCEYADNDESNITFTISRRKYAGEPKIYNVVIPINKAIDFTIDDMYYYILSDCTDDYGVIIWRIQ